jgi:MFS family permease
VIDNSAAAATPKLGSRFAKLWAANTASSLGSGLSLVAAPLFVASRTSDPLTVSAAAGVAWLPWLLFALPGGVLVDRVDRRKLMIWVDWIRVAAMGALGTAILTGHANIIVLYIVLFLINTGETVFRSAAQAMMPAVVPRAGLERANGWLSGGAMLTRQMIAGPLGGFLFVLAASIPFLTNAATYAVSAILIAMVSGVYRAAPRATVDAEGGSRQTIRQDINEGFRWLMHQRMLRTMALLIGLLNLTLTAALAVLVLLAKQRLHLDSVGYGLLFTSMAAGGILGSVFGDRLIRRFTATWTIRIGLVIEAGMHLVLATSHSALVVAVALFAFGIHGALWGIVANSLQQRLTPPDMLGRVGSTSLFIAAGGNCVGAVLGGVVAAKFGLPAPYWIGFVVAVVVAAATWRIFDRASVAEAYAAEAYAEPPHVRDKVAVPAN